MVRFNVISAKLIGLSSKGTLVMLVHGLGQLTTWIHADFGLVGGAVGTGRSGAMAASAYARLVDGAVRRDTPGDTGQHGDVHCGFPTSSSSPCFIRYRYRQRPLSVPIVASVACARASTRVRWRPVA